MRVALYARVSTAQQKTIPDQLAELAQYAGRRRWQCALTRYEIASGVDDDRSARAEVLDAARRREIDAVLVWKLDRWGRSMTDLVTTLHELAELGVAFVSVTEGFDLTTSAGRALAGMLAVFAEFERDVRAERARAGIERARRAGKHMGRPRKLDITGKLKARELWREGLTRTAIAEKLGVSAITIWRALRPD